MERNAVLFLLLSIAIIVGYSVLFPPAPPPQPDQSESRPPAPVNGAGPEKTAPGTGPQAVAPSPPTPSGTTPGSERTVVVETNLYRATLSTRGGVITSWRLARYTNGPENRTPIDLLTPPPPGGLGPLSVVVEGGDEEARRAFQEGLFTLEGGDLRLSEDRPVGTLRFEARTAGGAVLAKRLTFHHDDYLVDVDVTTWGLGGGYRLTLGENFGIREWGDATFVGYIGPSSLINGKVVQDKPSKLGDEPAVHSGRVSWTALQDKYFLTALIPASAESTVVAERFAEKRLTIGLRQTAPADGKPLVVRLYAGPKEYDRLAALQIGLQETIDFGWFIYGSWSLVRLIAEPLFLLLQFLHGFTGNYGIAIILLTTLIKTAFAPLSHKSFVSMKAMAALQPQTQALQKKYKHDKMKLNQELMSLYKTNKVNPLGGCLPMVVQIPFFIALFNILYTAIELRQAPFVGWIKDLSVQDPYYVLPVLMGVTMFIQQKMQPTTMDPRQAKIMLFLPVIFTFFFLAFPAGLVLYWMTNNILTILQQYVTLRYYKPQPLVIPKGLSTSK